MRISAAIHAGTGLNAARPPMCGGIPADASDEDDPPPPRGIALPPER